jgi:hypothetical protein
MFDRAENDLFKLAILLIIVAYFVGFSTDAATLLAGITNLFNVATGRNSNGQFANYPGTN